MHPDEHGALQRVVGDPVEGCFRRTERVFVAFHVSGIITRIALGALAERRVPTRHLLLALGVVMGAATAAAATFDPTSPRWWIYAVTVALGAGGNGRIGANR